MNNIKINNAETIFEPFWDSGESYPEHHKYSRISSYEIKTDKNSSVSVFWAGIRISIAANETVVLQKHCDLTVSGYDIFRMFAAISKDIEIKISCVCDGKELAVIACSGKGNAAEYDGKISGKKITAYTLRFTNHSDEKESATLSWLGLSNSEKQKQLESDNSGFDADWEGCFCEGKTKIEPVIGIFFDKDGLTAIREKVKKEPYSKIFADIKERAMTHINDEPEKYIGEFVPYVNPSFVRERDKAKPEYCKFMEDIAFVGLVENDMKMLKMACRMALSLCCCKNWCESIMGAFPGTTWHHRSFTEERIGVACMKVLDWAGSLLTWHGKNIIYDSVIMKALPRLDADIKTMDYIWYMNQGVFFAGGLVAILIGLAKRYPRYNERLLEAESDLIKIWENYVSDDGGSAEGPAYWMDSFRSMVISMYILARNRGKSLKEYIPDIIKKSEGYALCMLSDIDDGFSFLPINDTRGYGTYHSLIPAFFAQVSDNPIWQKMFEKQAQNSKLPYGAELIIISGDNKKSAEKAKNPKFITLNTVGHTMIKREGVHLHITGGGLVTFGHSHSDKGSFILEADGVPIFIDCGVCDYSSPDTKRFSEPKMHNLLIPDIAGAAQDLDKNGKIGEILCAEYKNGVFRYETDLKTAWREGLFKKNKRSILSEDPCIFEITDDIEYETETASIFNLNTYGKISEAEWGFEVICGNITAKIIPKNWKIAKAVVTASEDGRKNKVNNLMLYSQKSKSMRLVTEIEIVRTRQ